MDDLTVGAAALVTASTALVAVWATGCVAGRRQRTETRLALTPAVATATVPPPPGPTDPPSGWDDPASAAAWRRAVTAAQSPQSYLEALAPLAGTADPAWADLARSTASDWAAVNTAPVSGGGPRVGPWITQRTQTTQPRPILPPEGRPRSHRAPRPSLRAKLGRRDGDA